MPQNYDSQEQAVWHQLLCENFGKLEIRPGYFFPRFDTRTQSWVYPTRPRFDPKKGCSYLKPWAHADTATDEKLFKTSTKNADRRKWEAFNHGKDEGREIVRKVFVRTAQLLSNWREVW